MALIIMADAGHTKMATVHTGYLLSHNSLFYKLYNKYVYNTFNLHPDKT